MFIFYLGKNKLEINAFVDVNKVFERMDYRIMNIMGSNIKVNNALSILREKYKLRRQKDLQFNNNIQIMLNSYLENKQSEDFDKFYNKMILTDKIRDFLNGISFGMVQSESKLLSELFNEDTRLDSSKRIDGWFKHDVSYMVDLLYCILSEMGIANHFAANVNELISFINKSITPVMYDPDDLPF